MKKRNTRPAHGRPARPDSKKRTTASWKKQQQTTKGPKRKVDQPDQLIRLNKYIANAGVCSRREADTLIEAGEIKVNGKVIKALGYKVKSTDKVTYKRKTLRREQMVYVLLNKPKDFITTTDDPENRRTVMQLVAKSCEERIYPVGRLDRNTTGLLLLTNDGALTKKLSHPSHQIKKLYQVEIDKPITKNHFHDIIEGVTLEDGLVQVDDLAVVAKDAKMIGLELHSGRNRVVRRLFEKLGYEVLRLDRVMYAGLTKKDLGRGKMETLDGKRSVSLNIDQIIIVAAKVIGLTSYG